MYSRVILMIIMLLGVTANVGAKSILILPSSNDNLVINTTNVKVSSEGQETVLTELLLQSLANKGFEIIEAETDPQNINDVAKEIQDGNFHDILEFTTTNSLGYTSDIAALNQGSVLKPSLVQKYKNNYKCDYILYSRITAIEVGVDHNDSSLEAILAMRFGKSYNKEMPIIRVKNKIILVDANTNKCIFSKYYYDKDENTQATMEDVRSKLTVGSRTINDEMIFIAMLKITDKVGRDLKNKLSNIY